MPSGDAAREIKDRLDIVELISTYVRLQRSGRDYKGLCPFHSERSPSFTVSAEKQVWYCFGCGEGGDLFRFVEKAEGLDFPGALSLLAEKAGVVLEKGGQRARGREKETARAIHKLAVQYYGHVLTGHPSGARGLRYLRQRGVEDETIATFQLGFAPASRGGDNLLRFLRAKGVSDDEAAKAGVALSARDGRPAIDRFRGRLMFPIFDETGVAVGFGGRAMDDTPPKYLNSQQTVIYDKGRVIYGLSHARKSISDGGSVLLVEGYFDVIMAHQNGITTAVASSGTAVTEEQLKLLRRFATDLLLCLDSDEAGRNASERAIEMASRAGMRVRVVELPNAKDPGEFFQKTPQIWDQAESAAMAGWEWWLDGILRAQDTETADGRARAAAYAVGVLNRIPEEATLDIYCQLVGERLRLDPARLLADVQQFRKTGRLRPRDQPPMEVAAVPSAPTNGHVPASRPEEDRLLQLLASDPSAVAIARQMEAAEPFGSPELTDLWHRIGEVIDAGGSLERNLDRFNAEEGARLARLSFTAGAPGTPEELQAAVTDCVERIRLKDYESAMAEVEERLADPEIDDAQRTAALSRHHDLAHRRSALRGRLFRSMG